VRKMMRRPAVQPQGEAEKGGGNVGLDNVGAEWCVHA
jgi:hypothetical protein